MLFGLIFVPTDSQGKLAQWLKTIYFSRLKHLQKWILNQKYCLAKEMGILDLIQNRDQTMKSLTFLDSIKHDRWKVSPIACLRIIQSHVPRMNSDTSSELLMCAGAYFSTTVCRKGIHDGNSDHVNQSQNKNWYCDWLKGVSSKPSGKLIVAPFLCF